MIKIPKVYDDVSSFHHVTVFTVVLQVYEQYGRGVRNGIVSVDVNYYVTH